MNTTNDTIMTKGINSGSDDSHTETQTLGQSPTYVNRVDGKSGGNASLDDSVDNRKVDEQPYDSTGYERSADNENSSNQDSAFDAALANFTKYPLLYTAAAFAIGAIFAGRKDAN